MIATNSNRQAVVALVLLGLSGCGEPATTGGKPAVGDAFQSIPFDQALAKALEEKKVVMIDFYADWCPPCKLLDKETWPDPEVRQWLAAHTVPIKIDVDAHRPLAKKFEFDSIPVLIFLKPDGTEIGRIEGFVQPKAFLEQASKLVK